MQIAPFKLERYFAEHEFSIKYLLCTSDCQGLGMSWLLEQADEESLELWQNLTLGYTESLGHPLLRERIAHIYHSYHGVRQTEPSDVLVVSGPEEGIFIILNSLVGSGDHIITTWPAYQSLHEIANAIGSEVTLWPLREEQQWEPDEEFLKRNIKENTNFQSSLGDRLKNFAKT